MARRPRHPKKEVEGALAYAEAHGWTVTTRPGHGHAWGIARCSESCVAWVWSTPRSPDNHARDIRHAVDRCEHQEEGTE
jgi:hypothetical protein